MSYVRRDASGRCLSRMLGALASILLGLLASACATASAPRLDPRALILPTVTPLPTATPTPTPVVTPTATLFPRFYVVQPGDTLWSISRRFGVDIETLVQLNELEDPNLLRVGQELVISGRTTISGRELPTPTPTPIRCPEGCLTQLPGCAIKAVVARLDNARYYLLPEDSLYPLRAADLWFCREEDARRAGWRHWTPYGLE